MSRCFSLKIEEQSPKGNLNFQHAYHRVISISVYLFVDGLLNFVHNVVAFSMISLVTPLSYSIANSTKRIVVICISLLILRNPVTTTNVFGMTLALLGVTAYNKVRCSLVLLSVEIVFHDGISLIESFTTDRTRLSSDFRRNTISVERSINKRSSPWFAVNPLSMGGASIASRSIVQMRS